MDKITTRLSPGALRRAVAAVAIAVPLAIMIPAAATATRVASAPLTTTFDPAACLTPIQANRLANSGLTLAPAVTTPVVSSASAVAGAAQLFRGFSPRDVCLAHVTDAFTGLDADVWIVDITPPGGFQFLGGPVQSTVTPTPNAFLVAVFDAHSGAYLFGRSN